MSKQVTKRATQTCSHCDCAIGVGPAAGIKHYQKVHPLIPDYCYEVYGDTWDPTLTRLIRRFVEKYAEEIKARRDVNVLNAELVKVVNEKNSLTTRLNMVILALEQGQPK